jgi:selenocysteine lyase/cysteine desulfurase
VGILYSREGLLEEIEPDRLRTQDQRAPYRIETGTLNHAALAGVLAAVEYLAAVGDGSMLRQQLVNAFARIGVHERTCASALYERLRRIKPVTIYGPTFDVPHRAPTVSFTLGTRTATEVSRLLADQGICTWDGHFYAIRAIEALGLAERGGVTRMGICMYNTMDEVDRVATAVEGISGL